MKLTYLHQSVLLGLALAERENEILEQHDIEAIEDGRQDDPVDLRVIQLKATRELGKDINLYWSGDSQLQDFEEYPKLHRFLKDSLLALRKRVFETELDTSDIRLISMDTLEIVFTV